VERVHLMHPGDGCLQVCCGICRRLVGNCELTAQALRPGRVMATDPEIPFGLDLRVKVTQSGSKCDSAYATRDVPIG
jgi:hypothetical protein